MSSCQSRVSGNWACGPRGCQLQPLQASYLFLPWLFCSGVWGLGLGLGRRLRGWCFRLGPFFPLLFIRFVFGLVGQMFQRVLHQVD